MTVHSAFGKQAATAMVAGLLMVFPARGAEPEIRQEGGRVMIRTAALEMAIEGGAVVVLEDRRTGDVFCDAEPWPLLGQLPSGSSSQDDLYPFSSSWRDKPERYAQDKEVQQSRRRPGPQSPVELRRLGPAEAEIVYRALSGAKDGDELSYRVRIDGATGEIVLAAAARHADPAAGPVAVDVPLVSLRTDGVILANGARYARNDPAEVDYCVRWANNLYSPRMAVVEGRRGCLAVWAERPDEVGNLVLAHGPSTDHLILHAQRDPLQREPNVLRSTTWRIGSFASWTEAARRYRAMFAAATGAKPLWENRCRWVRNIHTVVTEMPSPAEADAFYGRLAATIDPARLLLFYWNGDRIAMFGDHRYMTKLGRPKPEVIAALKRHGFRWIGYHPYVLIYSPKGARERLADLAARNELPPGYVFTPDYGGPAERWHECFRPVATGYYHSLDEAQLWVLHPGSTKTRAYLVRNFANYCRQHGMDGAYMDILGGDADHQFPADKKVFDAMDFRRGEARALSDIEHECPDLAVMSEIQSEWTAARTFYTWEGATHFLLPRKYESIRTKVNHPLRTAIWGSFLWTREDELDPAESALIGALPTLVPGDDWSTARAKLFARESLFNDLPERWDANALACYRGSEGRWFEYRRLPLGDGLVERTATGTTLRLGRFLGHNVSPLAAARIQDWPAYRQDRPIGLDPERVYPFLLEPPKADDEIRIAELPEGVAVRSIDQGKDQTVIALDRATGSGVFFGQAACHAEKPSAEKDSRPLSCARITVRLGRRCLQICTPSQDLAGPLEPGTQKTLDVPIPGGLVFVWNELKPVDGRSPTAWVGSTGRTLAHGVPDHFWCFNSYTHATKATLGGQERPAVSIGVGRYRGYASPWVHVPPSPAVLRFDLGYAPPEKNRPPRRPLRFAVAVNGREIWSDQITPQPQWQPRESPLSSFAGRTVLVTLSARVTGFRSIQAEPDDAPALFGQVRIEPK